MLFGQFGAAEGGVQRCTVGGFNAAGTRLRLLPRRGANDSHVLAWPGAEVIARTSSAIQGQVVTWGSLGSFVAGDRVMAMFTGRGLALPEPDFTFSADVRLGVLHLGRDADIVRGEVGSDVITLIQVPDMWETLVLWDLPTSLGGASGIEIP